MSWFSKLNPTPAFPDYTGPYKVGSVDVEIPAKELNASSLAPDPSIGTVAFRIFYPCEPGGAQRPVRWLPDPAREFLAAYACFLGANPSIANILALFPQHFYYITIPVHRNAPLSSDRTARWPVMMFSHGLGGSRNAYSHLCGSIASHGVVVIAPDHRDGSAPVSFVRATDGLKARALKYTSHPHEATPEVYKARDEMLRVRLWELGLIHDALLRIDEGKPVRNLDSNSAQSRKKDFNDVLSMFHGRLDVHRPGAIAWAGHSFGAATMHQFVKSVYYRPDSEKADYTPLFTPDASSEIVKQITPSSLLTLLDMWCLPLKSPDTRWLWEKPLPCYTSSGPGGKAIIAICSEDFFKWKEHLSTTKHALSEAPASDMPPHTKPSPHFFYPVHSAHLSQSDFGILFPWMTKKMFNAEEPEGTLELNVRAVLQFLRTNDWDIAGALMPVVEEATTSSAPSSTTSSASTLVERRGPDSSILDPSGNIKNWIYITTDQGTADLIKRENSPGPGAVKDVVQREVLTDVTKKPSRWHRSKSSGAATTMQRSRSSDVVSHRQQRQQEQQQQQEQSQQQRPRQQRQQSAKAGNGQGIRMWTSVIARPPPAGGVKQKGEAVKAKEGDKEKRPKQMRRISFRRGFTYA